MNTLKMGCGFFALVGVAAFVGAIIGALYVGYYLGEVLHVPVPAKHRNVGHNDMLPIGLILYEIGFVRGLEVGALSGVVIWFLLRIRRARRFATR